MSDFEPQIAMLRRADAWVSEWSDDDPGIRITIILSNGDRISGRWIGCDKDSFQFMQYGDEGPVVDGDVSHEFMLSALIGVSYVAE